ncbi:MAG: MFS transporter [Candidatus Cloacimonetes bacterium HGW-Cloacimonetes-3]|jgi:MFS family permease|nr:MAG: MFS transporter [Candidatus Cloacimonetes bacterium HGW-Cloacimonetes-3]
MKKTASRKNSIIHQGYRISILEGIFAQVYGNLAQIGSSFITKLMVIMGATPMHYSLLSALGQASAIWQPLGVALTHKLKQRKMACIWITAAGRILTLFLGLALLFPLREHGIWFILILLAISAGLQSMGANIWIAWISDLIPLSIRGRFFSRRNQILISVGLVLSYILSFHVDLFEPAKGGLKQLYIGFLHAEGFFSPQNQAWFLAGIFVFATLIGLGGLFVLGRQPERPMRNVAPQRLRSRYSEPFHDKNFRLLLGFGIWWMLAIGVGSPFWGPYMLKKLSMSLFEMQMYGTIHMVASLLSFQFWGKFIDRFGNKSAMKICVALGGLNPMFWLFTSAGNYNILWFEGLLSGFMWAGTGIITTNFILSIAAKGKEQVYSGLYAALTGSAMMISTLASGVFYPGKMDIGLRILEPEQVVFGIGGIMRWLAIIPLFFVVEKRGIPLRKALAASLLFVIGRVSGYWPIRFKRM